MNNMIQCRNGAPETELSIFISWLVSRYSDDRRLDYQSNFYGFVWSYLLQWVPVM